MADRSGISPYARVRNQPARPARDMAAREILDEVIGRESLVEALEFATFTESPDEPPSRERQLLNRLSDPTLAFVAGNPVAITTHMKAVGLLLPEMIDLCRRRDVAIAMMASSRRVGTVVDGLGEMAEPRWLICPKCGGEGEVVDESAGPVGNPDEGEEVVQPMTRCLAVAGGCDGSGKIRRSGDMDAAKLFLEVHGMRKGGAGGGAPINLNLDVKQQQNNVNSSNGNSSGESRKAQSQELVTTRVQNIMENGG